MNIHTSYLDPIMAPECFPDLDYFLRTMNKSQFVCLGKPYTYQDL